MAYVISRSGSDWEEIYVKDCQTGNDLQDHILWAKFTNALHKAILGSLGVGEDIDFVAHGLHGGIDVLGVGTHLDELRVGLGEVAHEEIVAVVHARFGEEHHRLVLVDTHSIEAQGLSGVHVEELVVGLRSANLVVVDFLHRVLGRCLLALLGSVVGTGYNEWREVVPEGESVLEDVTFADDRMILQYAKDNCTHLYTYTTEGKRLSEIQFPTFGSASVSGKRGQKEVFYTFTSYTVPTSVYSYDMASGKSSVLYAPKVSFRR